MNKKIAVVLASLSLFMNAVLPAFASTTLEITGNGADSNNNEAVSVSQSTAVIQTNTSNINNDVYANSNTGGNKADKNTGGIVTVDTGNSKTTVSVDNAANSNVADVKNCNCSTDAEVTITGNGAESKNDAYLDLSGKTVVAQTNDSNIANHVNADSNTGDNKANKNTGGDVEITTGKAWTDVEIHSAANSNWANVGGSHGSNGGVSLRILGNGADSHNNIKLALDNEVLLQQQNDSQINNWVDADANTGKNKANSNTGGSVLIDTGNAFAGAAVDNAANFNWANVDCDCVTDVLTKVAGNGADTHNHISAKLGVEKNVFQDNSCGKFEWIWDWGNGNCVDNHINSDSNTGDNKDKKNTGDPGVDPTILTGDSWTMSEVSNAGNANVYGSDSVPSTWPTWPGWEGTGNSVNVNVSFSLQDLLAALGVH